MTEEINNISEYYNSIKKIYDIASEDSEMINKLSQHKFGTRKVKHCSKFTKKKRDIKRDRKLNKINKKKNRK